MSSSIDILIKQCLTKFLEEAQDTKWYTKFLYKSKIVVETRLEDTDLQRVNDAIKFCRMEIQNRLIPTDIPSIVPRSLLVSFMKLTRFSLVFIVYFSLLGTDIIPVLIKFILNLYDRGLVPRIKDRLVSSKEFSLPIDLKDAIVYLCSLSFMPPKIRQRIVKIHETYALKLFYKTDDCLDMLSNRTVNTEGTPMLD